MYAVSGSCFQEANTEACLAPVSNRQQTKKVPALGVFGEVPITRYRC